MSLNVTENGLSPKQEAAALSVAQDSKSDDQIAAACGVTKRTLERWKKLPAFSGRVAEHRRIWRERLTDKGIADRQARVAALNDRWERLQRVLAERAADPLMAEVPGGRTGLLVRKVQLVKIYEGANDKDDDRGDAASADVLYSAKSFVEVAEYSVDTGLLKELREHEKQAAQELGQWTEKREVTGKDGGPIQHDHAIDPAALRAAEAAYIASLGGQPADLGLREGDDRPSDQGADRL